jgi:hypothetical protein
MTLQTFVVDPTDGAAPNGSIVPDASNGADDVNNGSSGQGAGETSSDVAHSGLGFLIDPAPGHDITINDIIDVVTDIGDYIGKALAGAGFGDVGEAVKDIASDIAIAIGPDGGGDPNDQAAPNPYFDQSADPRDVGDQGNPPGDQPGNDEPGGSGSGDNSGSGSGSGDNGGGDSVIAFNGGSGGSGSGGSGGSDGGGSGSGGPGSGGSDGGGSGSGGGNSGGGDSGSGSGGGDNGGDGGGGSGSSTPNPEGDGGDGNEGNNHISVIGHGGGGGGGGGGDGGGSGAGPGGATDVAPAGIAIDVTGVDGENGTCNPHLHYIDPGIFMNNGVDASSSHSGATISIVAHGSEQVLGIADGALGNAQSHGGDFWEQAAGASHLGTTTMANHFSGADFTSAASSVATASVENGHSTLDAGALEHGLDASALSTASHSDIGETHSNFELPELHTGLATQMHL